MRIRSIYLILLLLLSSALATTAEQSHIDDTLATGIPSALDHGENIREINDYENFMNMDSSQNVETNSLSNPIQTNSIIDEVHEPGRDSYIVDFGFQQIFTYAASQIVKDDATAYLEFYETAQFSVDLAIPVNLTLNYGEETEAGKSTNVEVAIFKVPTGASMSISYGFTIGGDYRIGPFGELESFELLNYSNTKVFNEFEVPLDPKPLTEWGVTLPLHLIPGAETVISSLFAIDLVLFPQLDVDITADLFFDGDGQTNIETLTFNTEESQSFNLDIDSTELGGTGIKFGLENFSMDFVLSLLWALEINFAGLLSFLSFLGPLKIKLFTYPKLPLAGLPTGGQAYGAINITPTTNLPEFSINTILNDDNGILEPGEAVSVTALLENVGKGPAFQTNVSISSPNVTISSGNEGNYLSPVLKDEYIGHDIGFTVPAGYTGRNITIVLDLETISANQTIEVVSESIVLRVLQSGDAYLKLDKVDVYEPVDGFWDAGESVRLDIDLSKIGTAEVDYAYIEVYATSPGGFTSNSTWAETPIATFSTWNATGIYLDAPIDIYNYEVDLYLLLAYRLTSGEIYTDDWIYALPIYPLDAIEDLDGIYATLVDGVDDGIFTAGETFAIDADIVNIGTDDSGIVVGYLFSDDADVTIESEFFIWNNHSPFDLPTASTNSILMTISPHAENQTLTLTLVLYHETWWGEISYDVHEITMDIVQQKNPKINLNWYEVYDETLTMSTLQPGETSLITVDIDVDIGPAFSVFGTLSSDNDQVIMVNDTSFYGDLQPGGLSSEGDGFVVHIPANFAGGKVVFAVNITSQTAVGDLVWEAAYFEITIAAGDTQLPSYSLNAPSNATTGEEVTVSVSYSDNVGIGDVHFAYYDYDSEEWIIESIEFVGSTGFEYSFTFGDQAFLYAFIIFDVSGNYAGEGLDEALQVDYVAPVSEPTDPTDPTTTTSTTPTTSEPEDPAPSVTSPSPISWLTIMLGLTVVPLFLRRLKKPNLS